MKTLTYFWRKGRKSYLSAFERKVLSLWMKKNYALLCTKKKRIEINKMKFVYFRKEKTVFSLKFYLTSCKKNEFRKHEYHLKFQSWRHVPALLWGRGHSFIPKLDFSTWKCPSISSEIFRWKRLNVAIWRSSYVSRLLRLKIFKGFFLNFGLFLRLTFETLYLPYFSTCPAVFCF